MLEVKVILHDAKTGAVSEIANLTIVDTGDSEYPDDIGNYDVAGWSAKPPPMRARDVLRGRVREYPRRLGLSVWVLVKVALDSCIRNAVDDWLPEDAPVLAHRYDSHSGMPYRSDCGHTVDSTCPWCQADAALKGKS